MGPSWCQDRPPCWPAASTASTRVRTGHPGWPVASTANASVRTGHPDWPAASSANASVRQAAPLARVLHCQCQCRDRPPQLADGLHCQCQFHNRPPRLAGGLHCQHQRQGRLPPLARSLHCQYPDQNKLPRLAGGLHCQCQCQATPIGWWPPLPMPVSDRPPLWPGASTANTRVRTGCPRWPGASIILHLVLSWFHSAPKPQSSVSPTLQPVPSKPSSGSHFRLLLLDPELIFLLSFFGMVGVLSNFEISTP